MFSKFLLILLPIALFLSSCGRSSAPGETAVANPNQALEDATAKFVNPFPPNTYEHFKTEPDYRKTYNVYRNHALLNAMTPETASLQISISDQRAQLLHDGQVAMDYPVATGTSSHPTPPGTYEILEKKKEKRSNAYGRVLDANGKVVISDASSSDPVPEGGKFLGASMPYWMRFTWTGIGHHIGNVPRRAASHGCVRGQRSTVPEVFAKVKLGTPVTILP